MVKTPFRTLQFKLLHHVLLSCREQVSIPLRDVDTLVPHHLRNRHRREAHVDQQADVAVSRFVNGALYVMGAAEKPPLLIGSVRVAAFSPFVGENPLRADVHRVQHLPSRGSAWLRRKAPPRAGRCRFCPWSAH